MRNNMSINIEVRCRFCRRSLMDSDRRVDGLPAVRFQAKILDKVGDVYLSQVYGSYAKEFDGVDDIDETIAALSCPHCHRPLPMQRLCHCGAPVLRVDLLIGGVIKFCSRNGCEAHSLEFENADDAFSLFKAHDATGLA